MLSKVLSKVFGNKQDKDIRKIQPLIAEINSLEPLIKSFSNEQLRAKTDEFKARLAKGETLNDLLVEAFAVVREAGVRFLNQRHYDEQMMGGIYLHQGKIIEMRTGEGKTLAATLPAYLNALAGKGVHIITANYYLAERDERWMRPVYGLFGLNTKIGSIDQKYQKELDSGNIPDELRIEFRNIGKAISEKTEKKVDVSLSKNAVVSTLNKGNKWRIVNIDSSNKKTSYIIEKKEDPKELFNINKRLLSKIHLESKKLLDIPLQLQNDLNRNIVLETQKDLDDKKISSELKQKFKNGRIELSNKSTVSILEKGKKWFINDDLKTYFVTMKQNITKIRDDESSKLKQEDFAEKKKNLDIHHLDISLLQYQKNIDGNDTIARLQKELDDRKISDELKQELDFNAIFELELSEYQNDLDNGKISEELIKAIKKNVPDEYQRELVEKDSSLSDTQISVDEKGRRWTIGYKDQNYLILKEENYIRVYIQDEDSDKLLFNLRSLEYQDDLDNKKISDDMQREFERNRASISGIKISIEDKGNLWTIKTQKTNYRIKRIDDMISVSIKDDKKSIKISNKADVIILDSGLTWQIVDENQSYIIRKENDDMIVYKLYFQSKLYNHIYSDLLQIFEKSNINLSDDAFIIIEDPENQWTISDKNVMYSIIKEDDSIKAWVVPSEIDLNNGKISDEFRHEFEFFYIFSINSSEIRDDLGNKNISENLKKEFDNNKKSLLNPIISTENNDENKWFISDSERIYCIKWQNNKLNVYEKKLTLSNNSEITVVEENDTWSISDNDQTYRIMKRLDEIEVNRIYYRVYGIPYHIDLDHSEIPQNLRLEFEQYGIILSENAEVIIEEAGKKWIINDESLMYGIEKEEQRLKITDLYTLDAFLEPEDNHVTIDSSDFRKSLDSNKIPDKLKEEFQKNNLPISDKATVNIDDVGNRWLITDKVSDDLSRTYILRQEENKIDIYSSAVREMYEMLGIRVAVNLNEMSVDEKKRAYNSDITYGVHDAFGFDYLRDNLVYYPTDRVQRELNYAIVDEVDSILIDEARTPLIISGRQDKSAELYYRIDQMVRRLRRDEDFTIDTKDSSKGRVWLTEKGIARSEELLGVENLYDLSNMNLIHHIEKALTAHELYKIGVDYVVISGEIVIIDEFTGRTQPGRRWSDGLHQAVEAKERVRIKEENLSVARITYQNYFRLYKKLAGMSGTSETESAEFNEVYKVDVVSIPTHKKMIRSDYSDVIYKTQKEKFNAIIEEIAYMYEKGRPVLVGTRSVETSEHISELLRRRHIPHNILNARRHDREAKIIERAGELKAVTIATNMAGRGVDILLGDGVRELGGLHVIGTERHESRRIDNQLRGRAGRQGDPGSSRFFLSLEDELMQNFASDKLAGAMDWLNSKSGVKEGIPLEHPWITKIIEGAQKKVEEHNFEYRKQLLKYDDVRNLQRSVIYKKRNEVMESSNLKDEYLRILDEMLDRNLDIYVDDKASIGDWDIWGLIDWAFKKFNYNMLTWFPKPDQLTHDETKDKLYQDLCNIYDDREYQMGSGNMRRLERLAMLERIDDHWIDHLYNMDYLEEGIHFVAYGQKDPLLEFKKEAHDMFSDMFQSIEEEAIEYIYKGWLRDGEKQKTSRRNTSDRRISDASSANASQSNKPKRNDPCPCGSGKKYKNCCGRNE